MENRSYTPQEGDPRTEAALKLLEEGIDRIHDSDEFKRYLAFTASFHTYSPNNQLLIWMQRPEATRVAGFHSWRKHGRYVRQGERAIKIFAPMMKDTVDPATGEIVEVVTGFKLVNVFDVRQTEGAELPKASRIAELTSETEAGRMLYDGNRDWLSARGVPLFRTVSPSAPEARGSYVPAANGKPPKIYVRPDLAIDMAAKTLAHETAHYVADHRYHVPPDERESVAEGSAFVVASHFGLDTADYSFGYIVHWNQDRELFRQKLSEIQKVSSTIIRGVENVLAESTQRPPEGDFRPVVG